jgi:hypothetical protein
MKRRLPRIMNRQHSDNSCAAEDELNSALVNADISSSYEEYLAIFDRFYADDVTVASDTGSAPLLGKARVLPILHNFLVPLHVIAEIGRVSVCLRQTSIPSDRRGEHHSQWSLDLVGATGRKVTVSWSSTRRWKGSLVVYERQSEHHQLGEPLTFLDFDLDRQTRENTATGSPYET